MRVFLRAWPAEGERSRSRVARAGGSGGVRSAICSHTVASRWHRREFGVSARKAKRSGWFERKRRRSIFAARGERRPRLIGGELFFGRGDIRRSDPSAPTPPPPRRARGAASGGRAARFTRKARYALVTAMAYDAMRSDTNTYFASGVSVLCRKLVGNTHPLRAARLLGQRLRGAAGARHGGDLLQSVNLRVERGCGGARSGSARSGRPVTRRRGARTERDYSVSIGGMLFGWKDRVSTYREVRAGRGAEVGDGLRLLLEDTLDGRGLVADGHDGRGGVLVCDTLDADAGVREA